MQISSNKLVMPNKREARLLFQSIKQVKNLNRKAGIWDHPMEIAVGVAVLVVFFIFLRHSTSVAGTFFSSETLKVKESRCAYDTQRALERGVVLNKDNDRDGDGLLDACDSCVCSDPCCGTAADGDLDGMPRCCDKDDNDRTVVGCNYVTTNDGRCVEGAPPPTKKV